MDHSFVKSKKVLLPEKQKQRVMREENPKSENPRTSFTLGAPSMEVMMG